MDHHDAPRLLSDRNDLGKEMLQIGLQILPGDRGVAGEHGADVFQRDAFESGEIVNNAARESIPLCGGHGVVVLPRLFHHFRRVVLLRPFPAENEDLKSGELLLIEEQRFGTVRQFVVQIGADPVEDGHEVVGDHPHAASAQIAEGNFVIFDIFFTPPRTEFDILVHGKAFDDIPDQTGVFDFLFIGEDLLDRPDLSVRDVMQGADHPFCARLPDIFQRDRILGSIPAERLFHEHVVFISFEKDFSRTGILIPIRFRSFVSLPPDCGFFN